MAALTDILRNAATAEQTDAAAAIAALLNADQLARKCLGRETVYGAADVLRLGRIVGEYVGGADSPPVPVNVRSRAIGHAAVAEELERATGGAR